MKSWIFALLLASSAFADCSAMGWGNEAICNAEYQIGGSDVGLGYILFGAVMWVAAAYIYIQRKALAMAYPFYIFGIILFAVATVASAEAADAAGNTGTASMMLTILLGLEWLLVISIGAVFLYVIIHLIDWLAKQVHVRLDKRSMEGKI